MLNNRKIQGVTLIEILLVLIIIGSILVMITNYMTSKYAEQRIEKAVMQTQQILNAALSYYIDYSTWPGCGDHGCVMDNGPSWQPTVPTLIESGYIPKGTITLPNGFQGIPNPWGGVIYYSHTVNDATTALNVASAGSFFVCIDVPPSATAATTAQIIAGRLPMAFVTSESDTECTIKLTQNPKTCDDPTKTCRVVAQVSVPGQNLNNARSLNFAGVYHNGACVPAPTCPAGTMHPVIFAAPVSVTGNYTGTNDVYPLSSFTAYPIGNTDGSPRSYKLMPNCTNDQTPGTSNCQCDPTNTTDTSCFSDNTLYWRVCLDVVTSEGRISTPNNSNWTSLSGTIMVMTRCEPNTEPSGSSFDVFQKN